jgi:Holliday junction resolvase RusA-like endonuclease
MTWRDDTARVRDQLLHIVSADPASVSVLVKDGEPVAWERNATNRQGHRFTSPRVKKAEHDLGFCLKAAVSRRPLLSNVALLAVFYLKDKQRRDADNLLKTVMDAGNQAGIWNDDCQVTTAIAFVELDPARPRTVIALCPTTSSLDRTVPARKHPRSLV